MRVQRWLPGGRLKIGYALPAVLLLLTLLLGLDPRLLDPGVVNGKLPAGQVAVEATSYTTVSAWWTATAVMLVAVLARRRLPRTALALAAAGLLVHLILPDFPPTVVDAAPAVALYTVAAHSARRADSIAAGAAAVLAVAVTTFVGSHPEQLTTPMARQWPLLLLAVAWPVGDGARSRRAYSEQVEARARELQARQQEQAEAAAAAERARIAREMHDVVAHGLSVIVIQAQAAAQAMDDQPDVARAALDAIVGSGRGALTEMRRLFDLHDAHADVDPRDHRAPLPALGDLPDLVDRVRAAGLPVTLTLDRPGSGAAPVPALVELSAYRIVQEGLTNTLKHAGPGARADVSVRCAPADVQISVLDTGTGPAPQTNAGHGRGLRGIRERVTIFGGELRAGPGPDGGFGLYARLPFDAAPAGPRTSRPGAQPPPAGERSEPSQ